MPIQYSIYSFYIFTLPIHYPTPHAIQAAADNIKMRDDQDKVHRKQQEVTKLKEQRAARAAGHNKQSVIKSAGDKEGEAGVVLYYYSIYIYRTHIAAI